MQVRAGVEEQHREYAEGQDEGVDRGGVGSREAGKGAWASLALGGCSVRVPLTLQIAFPLQYLEGEITTAQKCVRNPLLVDFAPDVLSIL